MITAVKQQLLRQPAIRDTYVQLRQQMELWPRQARYRRAHPGLAGPQIQAAVETLRREGLVVFPGLIAPEAVAEMRGAIDRAVGEGRYRYDKKTIAYQQPPRDPGAVARLNILDPSLLSPRFVEYALHEQLVRVVEAYLQIDFVIAGIVAYRTQPVAAPAKGAFLWHYDHAPLQVKAICYLTPVAEEDGPFAYVKGSHRARRSLEASYEETRIEEARVPQAGRLVCTGTPGTVVLVDTNGIHRATPNVRGTRDVVSVLYDAGIRSRQVTFLNLPVPTPLLCRLNAEQRRMLRAPLYAE